MSLTATFLVNQAGSGLLPPIVDNDYTLTLQLQDAVNISPLYEYGCNVEVWVDGTSQGQTTISSVSNAIVIFGFTTKVRYIVRSAFYRMRSTDQRIIGGYIASSEMVDLTTSKTITITITNAQQ